MDDLFKIDISFPVPGFSCLTFIISFRSWPRGPSSFSVAKKNHAEAVRRDHERL